MFDKVVKNCILKREDGTNLIKKLKTMSTGTDESNELEQNKNNDLEECFNAIFSLGVKNSDNANSNGSKIGADNNISNEDGMAENVEDFQSDNDPNAMTKKSILHLFSMYNIIDHCLNKLREKDIISMKEKHQKQMKSMEKHELSMYN